MGHTVPHKPEVEEMLLVESMPLKSKGEVHWGGGWCSTDNTMVE
jgi:hypothetical protein